jgi:hypothetical protein
MTEIRSYRRVFDLERRIYRVDRLRLNPGGVPVRGVVYFLALLSTVLVAARLPLVGIVANALPWYLRDLALPGASATVLSVIRVEGRSFHLAAHALVRYRVGPRRLAGVRRCGGEGAIWRPDSIVQLPDGSDGRMRRLRYKGPGAVLVAVEHERSGRAGGPGSAVLERMGSPTVILRQLQQARALVSGQVLSLGPAARLLVRAQPAERRRA